MRKLSLLATVAGLFIGGSVARADFVITATLTPGAVTVGANVFDTYQLFLINTNTNGTGTQTNVIDFALYDSTGGGKNGILISAGTSVSAGYPDIFSQFGEASLPVTSWIKSTGWGTGSGIVQPTTTLAEVRLPPSLAGNLPSTRPTIPR